MAITIIVIIVAGVANGPGKNAERAARVTSRTLTFSLQEVGLTDPVSHVSKMRLKEWRNDLDSHCSGNQPSMRGFCVIPKPTLFPLRHANLVLGGWDLTTIKYIKKFHIERDLGEKG